MILKMQWEIKDFSTSDKVLILFGFNNIYRTEWVFIIGIRQEISLELEQLPPVFNMLTAQRQHCSFSSHRLVSLLFFLSHKYHSWPTLLTVHSAGA